MLNSLFLEVKKRFISNLQTWSHRRECKILLSVNKIDFLSFFTFDVCYSNLIWIYTRIFHVNTRCNLRRSESKTLLREHKDFFSVFDPWKTGAFKWNKTFLRGTYRGTFNAFPQQENEKSQVLWHLDCVKRGFQRMMNFLFFAGSLVFSAFSTKCHTALCVQ